MNLLWNLLKFLELFLYYKLPAQRKKKKVKWADGHFQILQCRYAQEEIKIYTMRPKVYYKD